ncbi:MAG TPA: CPBP family intramembrane glutamic endopeptidase [Mycobacteriales bacterium]|nr:CPBP family intramembrane glutamic endopeptidase [Mycobacteriales bacterium]
MTGPAGRSGPLGPRSALAVVGGVLVAANVLDHRVLPDAPVPVAAGLVVALLGVARAAGLTAADLGLARATWACGVRVGAAAAAAVLAGATVVLAVPALRDRVAPAEDSWADVAVRVLLDVPFGTVVPEELAFRGVTWALLRRSGSERSATLVSSALFGLWHVLPALGGGPANATVAGALGEGPVAVAARVAGTVLVTGLAGVVFCRLRIASGSLLAPATLHWALNSIGVLLVRVAPVF